MDRQLQEALAWEVWMEPLQMIGTRVPTKTSAIPCLADKCVVDRSHRNQETPALSFGKVREKATHQSANTLHEMGRTVIGEEEAFS